MGRVALVLAWLAADCSGRRLPHHSRHHGKRVSDEEANRATGPGRSLGAEEPQAPSGASLPRTANSLASVLLTLPSEGGWQIIGHQGNVGLNQGALGASKVALPRAPSSGGIRHKLPSTTAARRGNAFMQKVDLADIDIMKFELPTNDDSEELKKLRYSAANVMAMAVQQLRPEFKCTVGEVNENGFYMDFSAAGDPLTEKLLLPGPSASSAESTTGPSLTEKDLKQIKKRMDKIIKSKQAIVEEKVSREEIQKRVDGSDEPFKKEIFEGIEADQVSIHRIGDDWWSFASGAVLNATGDLDAKAIELQSVSGAYWQGNEKNPRLTRIYGTAWESKLQLKVHKKRMEEAKRRDHRDLGKKLDLFSIQEASGGGLVFWHPKGTVIRQLIEDFWKKEHVDADYDLITTPHIADLTLWKISGHHEHYKDDMFKPMEVEGSEYQIKPMNCPFHCLMFKDSPKSYRDLPMRWAELGTVYRYEASGALSGLFRVRGFTQDDAHIFCRPTDLEDEIVGVLQLVVRTLKKFGFEDFEVDLSTRPDDSVGSDEIWEQATNSLIGALKRMGWTYRLNEGDGAFYGPKIDFKIKDAIGRKWQLSTIQCDFNLPERFELEYTDNDGEKRRPIMIHRAIFGSIERFFGIMIENTAGEFPLWIAPTQLKLLPVTEDSIAYCEDLKRAARKLGIRTEVGTYGETLGKQIRNAAFEKLPLLVVVGQREMDTNQFNVRSRRAGCELGPFSQDEMLGLIKKATEDNVEFDELEGVKPVEVVEAVKETEVVS